MFKLSTASYLGYSSVKVENTNNKTCGVTYVKMQLWGQWFDLFNGLP